MRHLQIPEGNYQSEWYLGKVEMMERVDDLKTI